MQIVSFASQLTEDALLDAKNDVATPAGSAADVGSLGSKAATDEAARGKAVLTLRPRSESPATEVKKHHCQQTPEKEF